MMKRPSLFSGVVILAVLWFGSLFSFAQTNEIVAPAEAPKEEAKEETKEEPATTSEKPKDETADLKDPFISALPRKETAFISDMTSEQEISLGAEEEVFDYSSLVVTGLVWGTEDPKAIINGEVFGIGDAVNGGEIINISSDGILFKYKEKEYLMRRHGAGGRDQEAK